MLLAHINIGQTNCTKKPKSRHDQLTRYKKTWRWLTKAVMSQGSTIPEKYEQGVSQKPP